MKIETFEVILTLSQAEAVVLIDAIDLAMDAIDADPLHHWMRNDLRGIRSSLSSKAQYPTQFLQRFPLEAFRKVAVGCEVLGNWVDDVEPGAPGLKPEEKEALASILETLKAGGYL